MKKLQFYKRSKFPVEMHKVRIVQKLNLINISDRYKAITEAGNNTFLLKNEDVFLDMLTDSGVNAMSDKQLSSMLIADDAYAGSATYYRLENTIKEVFGTKYFLPVHQGRAAEHLISNVFVKKGDIILMNYHFTTTKALITYNGGSVIEIPMDEAFNINSLEPFKGNINLVKLEKKLSELRDIVPFVRIEAGTNLLGGQPFSLRNLISAYEVCQKHKVPLILDASLLSDNLYFIKKREEEFKDFSIEEITKLIVKHTDITYFSARKLSSARGGAIITNNKNYFERIREYVPLFEGFLTYGGISVREMEAMSVGLRETMDEDVISQGPQFIEYMSEELLKYGVPVVTPPGGLGCHLNANKFMEHLDQKEYRAGALASAIYLISGIRSMERGRMSEQRDEFGNEPDSDMELVRLALPRRVFTISQVDFAIDRIVWLYEHRQIIGGLKWIEEPKTLRFFYGRLSTTSTWQERLIEAYIKDLGEY